MSQGAYDRLIFEQLQRIAKSLERLAWMKEQEMKDDGKLWMPEKDRK